MFDIPSCDRRSHSKLFTSSLSSGELKSSPHHDINPLYHLYTQCVAHIYSPRPREVYMRYTPRRGSILVVANIEFSLNFLMCYIILLYNLPTIHHHLDRGGFQK